MEETLRAERQVRDEYDRFLREQPPQLSSEERARIVALSSDLPTLWHAPGTTHRDRKEIVRHLVEKAVVHVKSDSEYVGITIHWQGGFTSRHEIVRPVKSYEQLRDFDKLMDRIATLRHEGHTSGQIADTLNREGFIPPKRRGGFYAGLVRGLLVRRGLAQRRSANIEPLGPHKWWLSELAKVIPVSAGKLANWRTPGMASFQKDTARKVLGSLGRQAGGEATPEAGGLVSSWRRGVSGRTHHAKEATPFVIPHVVPIRAGTGRTQAVFASLPLGLGRRIGRSGPSRRLRRRVSGSPWDRLGMRLIRRRLLRSYG